MLAALCVPRGMSWQDAIVVHADTIRIARRGARRGRNEPARRLRVFRLVHTTQRLRWGSMVVAADQAGMPEPDDTASID